MRKNDRAKGGEREHAAENRRRETKYDKKTKNKNVMAFSKATDSLFVLKAFIFGWIIWWYEPTYYSIFYTD